MGKNLLVARVSTSTLGRDFKAQVFFGTNNFSTLSRPIDKLEHEQSALNPTNSRFDTKSGVNRLPRVRRRPQNIVNSGSGPVWTACCKGFGDRTITESSSPLFLRFRKMYAVIETGGKQYRVSEGEIVRVERLASPVGDEVSISAVHFVVDGNDVQVGDPTIAGASVKGTVVEEGRGRKVIAFKKKRRKGYRRKIGHRQDYTALRIDKIVVS